MFERYADRARRVIFFVRYEASALASSSIDTELVTFFPDGRVAVEVFSASGAVEDESALARLLDRLGPPKNA